MTRIDSEALAASLKRIERRPEEPTMVDESLRRVIDACNELFMVDGSGLMLADEHGVLRYVVATEGPGRMLEDTQIDAGEGPCVDTFVQDRLVMTEDVATDPRWPELGPLIAGRGVGAVLGVPVRLSGGCVGSLDLYRSHAHTWDESEQQALVRYGEVIETMLAAALSAEQAGELANQLNYALEYRVVIERGIGYLMARDGIDQTTAFNRIRSSARSSRRKIGDVAAHLLSTGRLVEEDKADS